MTFPRILKSLLCVFLLMNGAGKNTFANEDLIFFKYIQYPNLHFSYVENSDTTQNFLAVDMIREWYKKSGYDKSIYVEFHNDAFEWVKRPYALSYYEAKEIWFDNGKNFKGIRLVVFSRNIRPKEILNLLQFAANNEAYLKSSQDSVSDFKRGYNSPLSISSDTISYIASNATPMVNEICRQKFYEPDVSDFDRPVFSYYYQDSLFYFYHPQAGDEEKVLFSTKDFQSIGRDSYFEDGYVFLNDTSFYFVAGNGLSKLNTITGVNKRPTRKRQVFKIGRDRLVINYLFSPEQVTFYYIGFDTIIQNIEAPRIIEKKVKVPDSKLPMIIVSTTALLLILFILVQQRKISRLSRSTFKRPEMP